eukprot:1148103-Pelagomonas_calceolata.AAC.5
MEVVWHDTVKYIAWMKAWVRKGYVPYAFARMKTECLRLAGLLTPRMTPPLNDTAMMEVPIDTSPGFKPGDDVEHSGAQRVDADK